MALFDRFRRNKSVLPDEVNQYYQTNTRRRTGVALLVGVIAFIITLVIIFGLFLAGRWAYRQLNNDDNKKTETTQKGTNSAPKTEESKKNTTPSGSASNSSNTSSSSQTSSTSTNTPSSTAPSSSSQSSTAQPATPATGDNVTLPHTGDEGL